jgi:hypothetical protein
LPQATAPARVAVFSVTAAAPLAATDHWPGGVAPTGPSLAAINKLKLCKCCKSSALACGNRRTKTLDLLTQISSLQRVVLHAFLGTMDLSDSLPAPRDFSLPALYARSLPD